VILDDESEGADRDPIVGCDRAVLLDADAVDARAEELTEVLDVKPGFGAVDARVLAPDFPAG